MKIFPCSAALAVVNLAHTADIREESAGISFVYCLQRERPDNSVGFHSDSGLDPADGGWSGGPYPIDYDADTQRLIVGTMQQTIRELNLPPRTDSQCAAMIDRTSTRQNSSHAKTSGMPSSA